MAEKLPAAEVIHTMPGRMRLRISERRGDAVFFAAMATGLSALPGVYHVDVRPLTGSIVLAHGPPVAQIGAAAAQAGLFRLIEPPAEEQTAPALSFDPRLALTVGLALVAAWQLLRGQIFPPALTAAWYAAHLAGLSALGDHPEEAE